MSTPTDAPRAVIAAVTAWLADDDLGQRIAATAFDRDPGGFLDAMATLWRVVADAIDDASEQLPSVEHVVQAVAIGIAQAECDDSP